MNWWKNLFPKHDEPLKESSATPHIPTSQATTDCTVYDSQGAVVTRDLNYRTAMEWVKNHPDHFVWLQLQDPNPRQMNHVGRVYELHELLVEDASTDHQRPKLERYDDCLTLVMRTLHYVDYDLIRNPADAVETGEVVVIVGKQYCISIQHGGKLGIEKVQRRLEQGPEDLSQGPALIMHAIADYVVDQYVDVTTQLDKDIDDLEEEVFDPTTDIDIDEIYAVKREVLEIKHIISPLRTPLRNLSLGTSALIPRDICSYFRDVEDHLLRAVADVQGFDEVLSSLIDAVAAKVGVQQTEVNRKLSAWAAIVLVPTLMSSIYGMNFTYMPLLQVHGAFYGVLAAMVVWSVTMYIVFRRINWL